MGSLLQLWSVLVVGFLSANMRRCDAVISLSQLEDCLSTHSPSDCSLPRNLETASGLLQIQGARIAHLPAGIFRDYRDVKILDLSHNNISEVERGTFAGMTSMTKLLLTSNSLESVRYTTFAGAERLKTLDLSRNNIEWIEAGAFAGLRRLMMLNLNHNKLSSVPSGVYGGLPHLIYLYVDDNRVTAMSPSAFQRSPSLKILRLNRNRIEAVPNIFGDTPSLARVGVSQNPLQCDCRSEPFRQWLRSRSSASGQGTVICEGPPEKSGTDLGSHAGILTCVRPFAIEVQRTINVYEGGYELVTPHMGGQPAPMLLWQGPSGTMIPRQRGDTTSNPGEPGATATKRIFVDENGGLVFSEPALTDSGVYTFRAVNVAGSFSSNVRVTVRRKPAGVDSVDDAATTDMSRPILVNGLVGKKGEEIVHHGEGEDLADEVATTDVVVPIVFKGLVGDREKQVTHQEENKIAATGRCAGAEITSRFIKLLIIACVITFLVTATILTMLFVFIHKRAMRRSKTFLGASPQTSERRHLQNGKAANYESGVSLLSSLTRISTLSSGSSVCGASRGRRPSNLNSYCSGSEVAAHCSVPGSDPAAVAHSVDNVYDQGEDVYEHPVEHPHTRYGGLPLPPPKEEEEAEEAEGYMVPRKTRPRAPTVPKRKYQIDETYASIDVLRPPA